jgi:hypothetical protein
MAIISVPRQQAPAEINLFLGVNEDVDGALGLKLGEASKMRNFKTTPKLKLKQREGYKQVLNFGTTAINGMILFEGKLIVATGGIIYEFEEGEF